MTREQPSCQRGGGREGGREGERGRKRGNERERGGGEGRREIDGESRERCGAYPTISMVTKFFLSAKKVAECRVLAV